jgi:hypothetical protein
MILLTSRITTQLQLVYWHRVSRNFLPVISSLPPT